MRHEHLSQQLSVRGDAVYPVRGTGPKIALLIDPKAIDVTRFGLIKGFTAAKSAAGPNLKHADKLLGILPGLIACLGDIQSGLVGRERQSIGAIEIISHDMDLASTRIEAI